MSIGEHYPEVRVWATMVMPDHLHGILFVERRMEQPLGMVIKGFKTGCNKSYRRLFSMPQQCCGIEDKKGDSKKRSGGYLWEQNYNDHILEGPGELDRWFDY